jgi:hypothetical protein
MSELLVNIILVVVFIAHFLVSWYTSLKNESWFFSLVVTITFLTPWMSHLWHILYGENRIKCEESIDQAFGWTPCFEPNYNTFVNTYEITLVVESLFFVGLAYYVLYKLFKKNLLGNILVFLFNTVLLTITLILLFASPPYLDNYEEIFNWTGFIVSLILWILVEIYLRVPYFGYVTI